MYCCGRTGVLSAWCLLYIAVAQYPSEYIAKNKAQNRNFQHTKTLSKPVEVEDYNEWMEEFDHYDEIIKYYPFQSRTVKWNKKVHILRHPHGSFHAFCFVQMINCTTDSKVINLKFQDYICEKLLHFSARRLD